MTAIRLEPVGRFSYAVYGLHPAVLDRLGIRRQWDRSMQQRRLLVARSSLPAIHAYADRTGRTVEEALAL